MQLDEGESFSAYDEMADTWRRVDQLIGCIEPV